MKGRIMSEASTLKGFEPKIETGLPLPDKTFIQRTSKYQTIIEAAFKMEPNQSMFLPVDSSQMATINSNLRRKESGRKFSSRRQGQGYRLWRIA